MLPPGKSAASRTCGSSLSKQSSAVGQSHGSAKYPLSPGSPHSRDIAVRHINCPSSVLMGRPSCLIWSLKCAIVSRLERMPKLLSACC